MSCCPKGAWGQLGSNGYIPKGEVIKVDDLNLYIVGCSEKCIIWNYDIFGFDGGRTKLLADLFAEEGFMVIIPDFYRGTWQDPSAPGTVEFLIEKTNWRKLIVDWENIVLPFAKAKGAKRFGCIGTCWGSYMVLRESAYDEMKVGVSMHPSHTPISGLVGEEEKDLLQAVKCPQLFMPAGGDAVETKPGGLAQQVLGDKLEIIEFNDMLHGWTTRGDMGDDKVNRDVHKAVQAALDFIKKHLN